jgi:uncharacterized protein YcnI
MRTKTILVLTALAFVLPQTAAGHVEPKPEKIKAGTVARVIFDVTAEEAVPAVEFAVQVPPALSEVTILPTAGWKSKFKGRIATWSGGEISPRKAAEFTLRARWPTTSETLVFPAIERYANGKTVHWIGPESSETPAARVTVFGGKSPPVTVGTDSSEDDEDHLLVWLILAAVAAGLLVLAAALLRRRRA